MSNMQSAEFRFYAGLNFFLKEDRHFRNFRHYFSGRPAIKDTIESLGVPHPEIDLVLVNGEPVGFRYPLADGDRISVYPLFMSVDLSHQSKVRPEKLKSVEFILDTHLGRLARYLRLFGFDAYYRNDYEDEYLARISSEQKRILLTRDRELLKRGEVVYGYCPRSTRPREQLLEVLRRFDLRGQLSPFSRCMHCNGSLNKVSKDEVIEELPHRAAVHFNEFSKCSDCARIYWRGSHFDKMCEFIDEIIAADR